MKYNDDYIEDLLDTCTMHASVLHRYTVHRENCKPFQDLIKGHLKDLYRFKNELKTYLIHDDSKP